MSDFTRHIDALAQVAVLCIGDLILDRFVTGTVDRISPEAPIPVLRIQGENKMLGGAGNVAANLSALGSATRFISVIGTDEAGQATLALLVERALAEGCHVVSEAGRQTPVKTRFIAAHQQLLRADRETVAPISADSAAAVLAATRHNLAEVGSLVLSDYGKGVLPPTLVPQLIAAAREAGRPVIVDPKAQDFARYRGATVITPNRRELAAATGLPTNSDDEVVAAARTIIETCGIEAVVATRSEQGLSVVTAEGTVAHLPAEAREVFDVSGAGDTVIATLAAALAAGVPLVDAARLANLAGGIVVGKVGTAVVHPSELQTALHHRQWRDSEAKVVTAHAALERIERWRRLGRRIGFTNGCFDLLHPGHVSLLAQARAACDALVVGLNSDHSVRRLKGPTRPVQSETARAMVLASLASVDLVVIFDQDTPLELIRLLRPEVLVKGADYRLDQVVGGAEVQSWGGRVLLADLEAGHSTSATIARLKG